MKVLLIKKACITNWVMNTADEFKMADGLKWF